MTDDECKQAIENDVRLYKKWGGGGIVENSSHGLHANWEFVRTVSRKTNVHIIHGTGHYIESVQPESVKHMSIEEMSNLYTNDIMTGVEFDSFPGDPIKCGAIGEVASIWPITGKLSWALIICLDSKENHSNSNFPFDFIKGITS